MRPLILLAPLALMACVPDPQDQPVSGRAAFLESCAACHGEDARGTGPLAPGLDPHPADLTAIAARNGGVFARDRVMSTIDGFARGAHFSPAMPEFGETDLGRTVIVEETPGVGTPIPEKLLALADYLESIQQP
jgi:mono/diheme cytochrome c family protein